MPLIFFKNHYKPLWISAWLLVKDGKIAEDVVQDVFLKVLGSRIELEQVGDMPLIYTSP
ncbi:hypothetical protein [Pedobacter sp. ASV28]|uniref:hypothetical protein n=1 Tax=Pedobacter sp. ASV28 TaxID=2795123 RepID=UPI0018EDB975|nr:hypothetical protein [Pedobacter sp. ASV28]